MDVIVNPTGSSGAEWSLDDRLGRHLGTIRQTEASHPFEIEPALTSGLLGVNKTHRTLGGAMSAIALRMGGACELNSQDWT